MTSHSGGRLRSRPSPTRDLQVRLEYQNSPALRKSSWSAHQSAVHSCRRGWPSPNAKAEFRNLRVTPSSLDCHHPLWNSKIRALKIDKRHFHSAWFSFQLLSMICFPGCQPYFSGIGTCFLSARRRAGARGCRNGKITKEWRTEVDEVMLSNPARHSKDFEVITDSAALTVPLASPICFSRYTGGATDSLRFRANAI
jgi:hypothetical protein